MEQKDFEEFLAIKSNRQAYRYYHSRNFIFIPNYLEMLIENKMVCEWSDSYVETMEKFLPQKHLEYCVKQFENYMKSKGKTK